MNTANEMESTNLPEKSNKGKYPESNLKGKNGRPTDYLGDITDERAYNLALLGYNNEEIAHSLGVKLSGFKRWLREKDSFRTAVYSGKDFADGKVVAGFFKKATGFFEEVEKVVVVGQGMGVSDSKIVTFKQYFPPDAGAALNWLKNRQPNLWSDKQQIEHSGEMSVTMDLNGGDAGSGEVINIDHEEIEEETDDE